MREDRQERRDDSHFVDASFVAAISPGRRVTGLEARRRWPPHPRHAAALLVVTAQDTDEAIRPPQPASTDESQTVVARPERDVGATLPHSCTLSACRPQPVGGSP